MAIVILPSEKPSGQTIPPLGRPWDETQRVRDAARTGEATPREIVEYSEHEVDKRKFHPLLLQAHEIIVGILLMTIVVFLLGWWWTSPQG